MGATTHDRRTRRRHRLGTVAAAAAVLVVATAGGFWLLRQQAMPQAAAPRPAPAVPQSKAPRVAAVTYEVSGEGPVSIHFLDPASGESVSLWDQKLPWRVEFASHAVTFVQITARRGDSSRAATHVVRALVDGVEVCSGTDHGGYMQSTCSELVPAR